MRQVKPSEPWCVFSAEEKDSLIDLIGTGRNAYLWVGSKDNSPVVGDTYVFSGAKTLRKLAKAILKNIPDR